MYFTLQADLRAVIIQLIGNIYFNKKIIMKINKTTFYSVKLVCNNNLQKRGGFYYKLLRIYYYKIEKTLEKMIILSSTS